MELNNSHYEQISDCFPRQRGNVSLDNLTVLNAILHVAENGCKWRSLPAHFGSWHTIYMRMSRWAKSGILNRVFSKLQQQQILSVKFDVPCLDSTSVKIHPDGTGALKNSGYNLPAFRAEVATPKFI